MPLRDQQHLLVNGYRLGYNIYGPENGKPVFYFHGSPSARIEFEIFTDEDLLHSMNVRVISVDRPGMGLSDFQPDRKILDWPSQILSLASSLLIDRFRILAYSLGGPYGMACAYAIPHHLGKVAIVSGAALFNQPDLMKKMNPGTRKYIFLPKDHPGAARFFLRFMKTMSSIAPKLTIKNAQSMLPEPDRTAVSNIITQKAFIAMVREAFRQGTRGPFLESCLAITNWGFEMKEIQMPVIVWHGDEDENVPIGMASALATELPDCSTHFITGEGHLSLFKNHVTSIFKSLLV